MNPKWVILIIFIIIFLGLLLFFIGKYNYWWDVPSCKTADDMKKDSCISFCKDRVDACLTPTPPDSGGGGNNPPSPSGGGGGTCIPVGKCGINPCFKGDPYSQIDRNIKTFQLGKVNNTKFSSYSEFVSLTLPIVNYLNKNSCDPNTGNRIPNQYIMINYSTVDKLPYAPINSDNGYILNNAQLFSRKDNTTITNNKPEQGGFGWFTGYIPDDAWCNSNGISVIKGEYNTNIQCGPQNGNYSCPSTSDGFLCDKWVCTSSHPPSTCTGSCWVSQDSLLPCADGLWMKGCTPGRQGDKCAVNDSTLECTKITTPQMGPGGHIIPVDDYKWIEPCGLQVKGSVCSKEGQKCNGLTCTATNVNTGAGIIKILSWK